MLVVPVVNYHVVVEAPWQVRSLGLEGPGVWSEEVSSGPFGFKVEG